VAGSTASNSGFELGKFANNSYELCNDATTGTVVDGLATLTTAGCAVKPTANVTTGVIGVVIANAGTSGTVTLVRTGSAYCSFDATATVVGDFVVPTPTANGGQYYLCHDAGSSLPSGTQVLGRVLQATSGGTTAQMFFDMPGSSVGPNSVSSVFGRTGVVVAASGDYSVSQVTGAAPLASPTFTGTVTEPDGTTNTSSGYSFAHALTLPGGSVATTQSAGDSSTKVATDAFVANSFAPLASPALTGTPTAPTASAATNTTQVATTAYVVATEAGTYATWTSAIYGSTSNYKNGSWTTPAAITVKDLDMYNLTSPAGCTTYPVIEIYDQTAGAEVGSFAITLAASTTFYTQVSGSSNVAAGHVLTFYVVTAGSGCSTNAGSVAATLTYVMQTH
jgi:hypothetical protein